MPSMEEHLKTLKGVIRMIKIPKFFHEILGEYQNKSDLRLIILFVLFSGIGIAFIFQEDWRTLSYFRQLILLLLFLDISGGVLSNLTLGTSNFYENRPKARIVFIAIHIQPLLIAWTLGSAIYLAITLWIYTLISALISNHLKCRSYHRVLCGFFTAIGICIAASEPEMLPRILYLYYVVKVLYNFSVNPIQMGGAHAFKSFNSDTD